MKGLYSGHKAESTDGVSRAYRVPERMDVHTLQARTAEELDFVQSDDIKIRMPGADSK